MPKGAVLLSGGLDSATLLPIAIETCDEVIAVHFNYNQQTADIEKRNVQNLCKHYNVGYNVGLIYKEITHLAGGVINNIDYGKEGDIDTDEISTGYVSARNLTLLAGALNVAETIWKKNHEIYIYIGAQKDDHDSYPDCRPSFLCCAEAALETSTDRNDIRVKAPLLRLTSEQVLEKAIERSVPLEYTFSCYNATNGKACGKCGGCLERKRIFTNLGVKDPIEYVGENER